MRNKLGVKNGKLVSYTNRGMGFEREIIESNQYYYENDIALITKRATPIKVIKADEEKITEAKFIDTSYLDFDGIYRGKYIAFEAKECNSDTSFPLSNIRDIQLRALANLDKFGAITFLFINFTNINKYFILMSKDLFEFIKENNRKSIPLSYLEKVGHKVDRTLNPPLDYLSILSKIIDF